MKRLIYSGVRPSSDHFYIDYTYNHPDDIMDIVEPQLYMRLDTNVAYHFGYKFKPDVDSKERTKFIHALKQIGDDVLTDDQIEQFISRPLAVFDSIVDLYDIDCMVYPLSNRSPLVSKIIRCISRMTPRKMHKCSFELVKKAPSDIQFDFESFDADYEGKQGYTDMLRYINEVLMPKLHNLDYFSIARDVKAKYRPYITSFIDFKDEKDYERFAALQGSNILVVDDINTTGSTTDEIIRKLSTINRNCNIYVFTLIGK